MLLVAGTVVSFAVGIGAIYGLLRFLRTRSTLILVVYRIVAGIALLVLLSTGVLQP